MIFSLGVFSAKKLHQALNTAASMPPKAGGTMRLKLINNFTDFGKGFIAGFILAAIIFILAVGIIIIGVTK